MVYAGCGAPDVVAGGELWESSDAMILEGQGDVVVQYAASWGVLVRWSAYCGRETNVLVWVAVAYSCR